MKASISRPWLKYYRQEFIDRELPKRNLYGQLKFSSEGNENLKAIEYYGAEITYGELLNRIDRYAEAFAGLGVRREERVSILSVSIPETICSIYALNKLGAVCNLIDVRTDKEHIKDYILKADSRIVIALDRALFKLADIAEGLNIETVLVQTAEESLPFVKRAAAAFAGKGEIKSSEKILRKSGCKTMSNREFLSLAENNESNGLSKTNNSYVKLDRPSDAGKSEVEKDKKDDWSDPDKLPAVIVRTGGTTGTSKGVVLTNGNINGVYFNFKDVFIDARGQSLLNVLPLPASYGIAVGIHMAFCMSLENILVPSFKPEEFADLVYRFRPNHIIGVPVFYESMMYSRKLKNCDLSYLMTMASGGDSANREYERRLREFTESHGIKEPLAQGYGMSEVASACSFGARKVHKDGSAGVPCIHTLIGIFMPGTEEELDIGETGEICIAGPTVMKEYLEDPEETANVLWKHRDGRLWIHSGDLGTIDEDGFLFVTGRIKRAIVRADGHKAYPVQIETAVRKLSQVKRCCVVAVKDLNNVQGEVPLVVAEKSESVNIGDSELQEKIMNICRENLEERSWPQGVVIDTIPITKNGKIDIKAVEKKGSL